MFRHSVSKDTLRPANVAATATTRKFVDDIGGTNVGNLVLQRSDIDAPSLKDYLWGGGRDSSSSKNADTVLHERKERFASVRDKEENWLLFWSENWILRRCGLAVALDETWRVAVFFQGFKQKSSLRI